MDGASSLMHQMRRTFWQSPLFWSICTLCIPLTLIALTVAFASQATGYEISIYTATPIEVWVLIIANTVACIILLLREALDTNRQGKRWLLPLSILIANSLMVIMMSSIRGYYAVGGDTLMHIGYVKDLANGIVSPLNVYPALHVIPAGLHLLGVPAPVATSLSPTIWYIIYLASLYGLAKLLWKDRREIILTCTIGAVLLIPHGVGLAATLVAAATFPLTLLILLKLRQDFNIKHILLYLALLASLLYIHALTVEVLIIALGIACVAFSKNRMKLVGLTIITVVIAAWWSGYGYSITVPSVAVPSVAIPSASSDSVTVLGNVTVLGSTYVVPTVSVASSIWPSMTGVEATQTMGTSSGAILLLRRYGSEILLSVVAILSLTVLTRRRVQSRDTRFVYFGLLFLALNVIWVAGWYLRLDIYGLFLTRMRYWVPTLSVILSIPLFSLVLGSQMLRKLSVAGVFVVIVAVSGYGIFTAYPSPIINVQNVHTTHQEIKGMSWIIKNGDQDTYIDHLNTQRVSRFVAALYGSTMAFENRDKYWLTKYEPAYGMFSYNDYQSIGDWYEDDVYLAVTKLDRMLPRWENDKLYLLENDRAASLYYRDSDEFEIWFIEGYGSD